MDGDAKAHLRSYLDDGRTAMLWKLEGVSEYDLRRPLTPTGTNLLGLVKHLAGVEFGYFGEVFDRPSGELLPWYEPGAEPNADKWATLEETRDDIVGLYRRATAYANDTIDALDLDAIGHVPWWPDASSPVTFHQILGFVITETHRHAGHADILRELIDGSAGFSPGLDLLADVDDQWWERQHERLERVARNAAERYS